MKEAAITHSLHAYVPKKRMTEEERRAVYHTRLDEAFKPYTVIDVLQKVYHRSFEDDLLSDVGSHPEKYKTSSDEWRVSRAWVNHLQLIRPESTFFQSTRDFRVDIAVEADIKLEEVRNGNSLLKNRYSIHLILRLRYSLDLRPCHLDCYYLGAILNERDSLISRDILGISMDKYLIPVLKQKDYEVIARYVIDAYMPECMDMDVPFAPERWVQEMGLKIRYGVFPENGALGEYFFGFGTADTVNVATGSVEHSEINPGTIIINREIISSEGMKNSTITHEGVHHLLGHYFFLLQKTHGHDYCSYMCKRHGREAEEHNRWTPTDVMEMQANKLPGYLMIQTIPGRVYAEKCLQSYGGSRTLENMRCLVNDMAEHFHTTKTMARTRLLDLGYNEVRGIMRTANGALVPAYISMLSDNETYTISEAEGVQEYLRNPAFRTMLNSGRYLYVDGHYCRNEQLYLFYDQFGRRHLTPYAREHMEECCLVFRVVYHSATLRLINGILQKGVGRGCKSVEYVGPNGESPVTADGKALRERIARDMAETSAITKSFNQMTVELMDRKKMTISAVADATGLSEETIRNMRNDSNRVFPIQGIVAFCIALHLSPETSRVYIEASPSKFLNSTDMKLYQYALAQWYELPVSMVNRRLVEAGARPLTSLVDGYDENGVRLA